MNKKAYIVPALEVQAIKIQQMICQSVASVSGDTDVEIAPGDPEPSGGGDSRRRGLWDDEEDY